MWETALIASAISIAALVLVWVIYDSFFNYPRIKKGKVVGKIFQDDRRWVRYKAVPTGRFSLFLPYLHVDDADWIIMIQDQKGREGKLFISEESYKALKIGDIYIKQRGDRYFDWVKTRGATDEEIETLLNKEPKE
jgi:hypothetical protein